MSIPNIALYCSYEAANRRDSPLLGPTLEAFVDLPEQASVHLDKAHDSKVTRRLLEQRA
jgi:hypothetical protein